jgi:hypothetical protein
MITSLILVVVSLSFDANRQCQILKENSDLWLAEEKMGVGMRAHVLFSEVCSYGIDLTSDSLQAL